MATKLPGIPAITTVQDATVAAILRPMKESIEILGSAVTGNAMASGQTASNTGSSTTTVTSTDQDYTPPPAPTNLTAAGAFSNIIISWGSPTYRNHAYTEVWRSSTNVLGNATLIGFAPGRIFTDAVSVSTTFYYWVRFVSTANVAGPYNASLGTQAATATDPAFVIASLTGQITETQIDAALNTRLNKIESLETTYGTTVAAAQSAASAAQSASDAVTAKTAAILAQGGAETAKDLAVTAKTAAILAQSGAETAKDSAVTAKTAAILAQDGAETAKDSAVTAKTNAETAAGNASTSATNAAASATTAGTSASNAATSATAAANSATAAGNSASAAATSATNASTYATSAETASTASTNAKVAAESARDSAQTSATAAATSASTATTKASDASEYATAANTSATNAATSASNAATSATNASSSATTADTSASNAATSATAAANSATAAGNSASAAATSATNASTYATSAETASTASTNAKVAAESARDSAQNSATAASTSANTATTKATDAATSATAANTSATNAATSASNAATSATNAASSATTADSSASNAATSATAAANSATAAGNSASAAATSASNASTYATNAETASTASTNAKVAAESARDSAQTSATAASTSASTATTKASDAAQSATAANTSATNAATSASNASTSATNAATSATNAASSASSASTSATTAANSATAAGNSATSAATSATNASTYATNAETSSTAASTAKVAAESAKTAAETAKTGAETSATAAATSASTASTKATEASQSASSANTNATNASTSAANAATSASNASTSATNASGYATAAANSLQQIQATSTGFDASKAWNFEVNAESWVASGMTQSVSNGIITLTSTSGDPIWSSPAISLAGGTFYLIRARVRRKAGTSWQGDVYYSTASHGSSESYKKNIPDTTVLNEWRVLEWDMSALSAGGTDWVSNTITAFRIDLGNSSQDIFDVDWVTVGRVAPQEYNAAIQQRMIARSASDGTALAEYSVVTDVNGRIAGFGLGSEITASGGAAASTFGLRADKFYISPPTDFSQETQPGSATTGQLWYKPSTKVTYRYNGSAWVVFNSIAPFIVQTTTTTVNGVTVNPGVYMDAAYIKDGTITNVKIGNGAIDDAKIANLDATKITSGYIDAARIQAGSIESDRLNVTSLSAITTNTGNLSVTGKFKANTAEVFNQSMTGSGGVINSDGTFAFGNSTTNVQFDGSDLHVNGLLTATTANSGVVGIGPTGTDFSHHVITFVVQSTKQFQIHVNGIVQLQYFSSGTVYEMEGTLELRLYDNADNLVDLIRSIEYKEITYPVQDIYGGTSRTAQFFLGFYAQRSVPAAGTYKLKLYTLNEQYRNAVGALLSSSLLSNSSYGFVGYSAIYQPKI